jgi:hypothetical protein
VEEDRRGLTALAPRPVALGDAAEGPDQRGPVGRRAPGSRAGRLVRPLGQLAGRPMVAAAVLLVLYVGLSFLNDPHGYLGTDTGGKVATLRAMTLHHGLNPDVGYWAARWDPTGRLHPLYYTSRIGGKWVNVTTLPALYLAYPLWRFGGYRLALLIPMLGAVAAALAARALAIRLGASRESGVPAAAFWLVGLASPLTIYALDFWEHSLGVALMAWALVLLLGIVAAAGAGAAPGAGAAAGAGESQALWKSSASDTEAQFFPKRAVVAGAGAGLLFGAAAAMRTESLVYGGVAVGLTCLALLWRRWRHAGLPLPRALAAPISVGLAAAAGLAIPVWLNSALEQATIGGTLRGERTAGTAVAVGSVAGSRLQEAALTAVGLQPDLQLKTYLTGAAVVALVLVAVLLARNPAPERRRLALVAGIGAVLVYLLRFATGLGFVPGMLAAAPVAIVGLLGLWGGARGRIVTVVALGSLPVVWLFQFLGGAAPQWGGRYLLTSGLLLTVLGVVELARRPSLAARIGVAALAVAVTVFGLAWLSVRSHGVADAERSLGRRPEPVLVSAVAHLAREGGGYFGVAGDKPWLTAVSPADLRFAAQVVTEAGDHEFGLVTIDDRHSDPTVPGFDAVGRSRVRFLPGVYLRVTTYRQPIGLP